MNEADLMRQAQVMQHAMEGMRSELMKAQVTGESGGGMVRVTLNGKLEAVQVTIDPALGKEPSRLEELVAQAITDASRRVQALQEEKLSALGKSMGLPPGMNLPF